MSDSDKVRLVALVEGGLDAVQENQEAMSERLGRSALIQG